MSMGAASDHVVRDMSPHRVRRTPRLTFRLNLAATIPMSADCDGGELNVRHHDEAKRTTHIQDLCVQPTIVPFGAESASSTDCARLPVAAPLPPGSRAAMLTGAVGALLVEAAATGSGRRFGGAALRWQGLRASLDHAAGHMPGHMPSVAARWGGRARRLASPRQG